jgi:hypothetical protein
VKTEVCVTVDVEYSIAGAFAWPDRFLPLGEKVVNCVVDGKEQGLGFILDSLDKFGMRGTFFIEPLQTAHFGDEPMGSTARRIVAAGQDLQLHLHPCWLHFRDEQWRQAGFVPNDSCAGRTDAALDEMLQLGIDAFARWGVPRPVALRTGGFRTDRAVFRAMARAGLPLASNISIGVFKPQEPDLQVWGGRTLLDGVLEVPALSYRSPRPLRPGASAWRSLAITATSKAEMENLLWQARRTGVQTVVVLTHPHEFIKRTSYRYDDMRINRVNQGRLLHLLDFLQRNSDEFSAVSFGERQQAWLDAGTVKDAVTQTNTWHAMLRSAENLINDHL